MKNRYLILAALFIITGCSTLNRATIENAGPSEFYPLALTPGHDIYDLRIDIIRQESTTEEDEEMPYHSVGFYLGNGLFYDLHDNLSLLVPELLHIEGGEDFKITQRHSGLIDGTIVYEKRDSLLLTRIKGWKIGNSKKVIVDKDSVVEVKEGLLSRYKILESEGAVTFQTGLFNTTIHKDDGGYYHRTLLGRKEFRQEGNELFIGKRTIIRSQGGVIEIYTRGLLNSKTLKYRMIKSGDKIIVYDRNYRGLEITLTRKEVTVMRNQSVSDRYSIAD